MPGTRQAPKGRLNSAQCEALGKKDRISAKG